MQPLDQSPPITTDDRKPLGRLAALGAQLASRGLQISVNAHGLVVRNPNRAGCCDEQPIAGTAITCRPRSEDDERPWYWTSWGEPIAPVDRIADAVAAVLGYLGCRPETVEVQR